MEFTRIPKYVTAQELDIIRGTIYAYQENLQLETLIRGTELLRKYGGVIPTKLSRDQIAVFLKSLLTQIEQRPVINGSEMFTNLPNVVSGKRIKKLRLLVDTAKHNQMPGYDELIQILRSYGYIGMHELHQTGPFAKEVHETKARAAVARAINLLLSVLEQILKEVCDRYTLPKSISHAEWDELVSHIYTFIYVDENIQALYPILDHYKFVFHSEDEAKEGLLDLMDILEDLVL